MRFMNFHVAALFAGGIALAAPLAAQGAEPDPRWLPWLGCWQVAGAETLDLPEGAEPLPVVCVTPTGSSTEVELVSVAGGKVLSRERVQAGGQQRARPDQGCTGWERAEWSADGRRLFRKTEHTCPGGITRRSSGLMAILPGGEWLSADGVSVTGQTDVRVLRYRPASRTDTLPAAATRPLAGRSLAVDAARTAAASSPTSRDLVEASRELGPEVVGAWLIERRQGFELDAGRLVALADAGVPPSVIDLMVALSNPDVFAIDDLNQEGEFLPDERGATARPPRRPVHYPWGYYPGYGYGYYPRYGYHGRFYGRPVVVVRAPSGSRGRAVKGRGYTRGSGDTGNTGSSAGRSTSKAGSGSNREEGRARSGSSGRTAKPRGGGN